MIGCCVCQKQREKIVNSYASVFIRDKCCCHLMWWSLIEKYTPIVNRWPKVHSHHTTTQSFRWKFRFDSWIILCKKWWWGWSCLNYEWEKRCRCLSSSTSTPNYFIAKKLHKNVWQWRKEVRKYKLLPRWGETDRFCCVIADDATTFARMIGYLKSEAGPGFVWVPVVRSVTTYPSSWLGTTCPNKSLTDQHMDIALPSLTIEGEIKGAATPSSQKLCVLIFSE